MAAHYFLNGKKTTNMARMGANQECVASHRVGIVPLL